MPRRAAALATPATSTPLTDGTLVQQSDDPFASQVSLLRRQWKWAVFSQFFYTFTALFAMPDVSLTDIEDDLTRSTSIVIHRVMHRLLVAATQDRKLSLDTWQTALRKQYRKRDPDLNPIGPEPVVQLPTPAPDLPAGPDEEEPKAESVSTPGPSSGHTLGNAHQPDADETGDHDLEPGHSAHLAAELEPDEMKLESMSVESAPLTEPAEESKDWLSLPMLTKLDSLHLLTEWQFHNVNRIRTIMRDDDETAQWRIEPIGYDSKANAYWLIGPDRLWIQRDIPKPPRNPKRKRAATKPKHKRPVILSDDESDTPPAPKKRKAVTAARSSTSRNLVASPKTPMARSSRTRRPPPSPEDLGPITSRGPRAAKMQASAKLSVQAKELAELQRQAALESRRSGKRVPSPSSPRRSSPRRPVGTRMSARLWGAAQGDDEWQEIPDEWLNERGEAEEGGASGSERLDGEAEIGQSSDPDLRPEPEPEAALDPDTDAHRAKTGLESDDDDVSELTELTEISPPATVLVSHSNTKKARKKSIGSRRKASRTKRRTLVVEDSVGIAQSVEDVEPEEEIEPEWRPPEDFVEWETICVTLNDWEHICERFEGATHYTEKALYKLLSQHIVPAIIAELREVQRKRHLEEAVSQRKRSSRLAIKENEKEEARLAALRRAEEEEKLGRVRRLEARQKREEEERMKREAAREKRRLDREERERRAQAGEEEEKTPASSSIDVVGDDLQQHKNSAKPPKAKPGRPRTKAAAVSTSASASGSRTPVGEDWMLDCEICHRSGVNKDDGSPLLCCGKCSRWQHIACHDSADRKAGRPKRDWDKEEFICRNCQSGCSLGIVANGSMRQVLNGSSSSAAAGSSYDAGRTPSPYYHHQTQTSGFAGQSPYGQNYLHPSLPHQQLRPAPYQHHTAITFSHYQPQQRGFTSSSHSSSPSHLQPAIPQTPTSYAQPHYSTHGSSSKLSQYPTSQYPSHIYSNGTSWPTPASASPSSSSAPPAHSAASWTTHAQTTTTNYPTISSSSPSSSHHHNSQSAERSLMSGAGVASYAATSATAAAAQNGNAATATATANPSVASAMQSPRSWLGNSYVPPVGGGVSAAGGSGGGGSGGVGADGLSAYHPSQSPQSQHSPQQHRAP